MKSKTGSRSFALIEGAVGAGAGLLACLLGFAAASATLTDQLVVELEPRGIGSSELLELVHRKLNTCFTIALAPLAIVFFCTLVVLVYRGAKSHA